MIMKNIILWVRRFVMIYGIIMICTFFMCLLFNPTSQLPVVAFFGRIIVFTLLGTKRWVRGDAYSAFKLYGNNPHSSPTP